MRHRLILLAILSAITYGIVQGLPCAVSATLDMFR